MIIEKELYKLHHGKLEEVLKIYQEGIFDSCVTDGPYGIGFMGREWDNFKSDYLEKAISNDGRKRKRGLILQEKSTAAGTYDLSYKAMLKFQEWFYEKAIEIYRVLKPGGYFLSFCAPRTYHRMACAIEDAGFEVRDQMMWIFGSGFPKSHNLIHQDIKYGTGLKPAHEPILVARKPMDGSFKNNFELHKTGVFRIDECRIPGEPWSFGTQVDFRGNNYNTNKPSNGHVFAKNVESNPLGRWPANVLHDGSDDVLQFFPEASGQMASVKSTAPTSHGFSGPVKFSGMINRIDSAEPRQETDKSAARFFYCAKTSPTDRNEGLPDGLLNSHPTVKPTDLMRYLVRLVTPKGGLTIDPMMGSGSTGKAALFEHLRFVGIDMDEVNIPVADYRIRFAIQNRNNQINIEYYGTK